jgi:hypothetical protein
MDNTADINFTGEVKGDWFGSAVSGAGDVNGDGYDDLAAGAPGDYITSEINNTGKVYVFLGGANMDNISDVNLTGTGIRDHFGRSVSDVGDVNKDGYDDLVVGAPQNNTGGLSAGRTFVYYGGMTMKNVPDLIFTGEADYNIFGCSVSGAGDIDKDGYKDILVGAFGNAANGSYTGRAYIYTRQAGIFEPYVMVDRFPALECLS